MPAARSVPLSAATMQMAAHPSGSGSPDNIGAAQLIHNVAKAAQTIIPVPRPRKAAGVIAGGSV
ncbi:MAG: hypothetical protein JSR56_00935 [Proteobacteria bacterium]|nr:hypothetical protein [Pseudomonadota bacterium]